MAKRNGAPVSATVKRLLAVEARLEIMTAHLATQGEALHALDRGQEALRADVNRGLGALLAALERLHGSVERMAELRPRVDELAARVAALEAHRDA